MTPPSVDSLELRAALVAGMCAAGPPDSPARHAFIAELAYRLARRGPFVTLTVRIAEDDAASEATLSVLTEMAGAGVPEAEGRLSAYEAAGDEQADLGSATRPEDAHALASVLGPSGKRARTCLVCGAEFEVNFRHADTHVCCSPACRAKKRRARQRRTPSPPTGGSPDAYA